MSGVGRTHPPPQGARSSRARSPRVGGTSPRSPGRNVRNAARRRRRKSGHHSRDRHSCAATRRRHRCAAARQRQRAPRGTRHPEFVLVVPSIMNLKPGAKLAAPVVTRASEVCAWELGHCRRCPRRSSHRGPGGSAPPANVGRPRHRQPPPEGNGAKSPQGRSRKDDHPATTRSPASPFLTPQYRPRRLSGESSLD